MVIQREEGVHYALWPLFVKKTKTNKGYHLRVKVHYKKTRGEDEEGEGQTLYEQLEEQMNKAGNERKEEEVEILGGLPR